MPTTSRQLLVFVTLYVTYVAYYTNRKGYGYWLGHMVIERGIPRHIAALSGSTFEICGGLSKIFLAFLVDVNSPVKVLGLALTASAGINILLCAFEDPHVIAFLWGLNGIVQALGWPAIAKIFMEWFPDPKERGRWYTLLSTNQNVGSSLLPLLLPAGIGVWGWKASLWVPGGIGSLCAIFVLVYLKDKPANSSIANFADSAPMENLPKQEEPPADVMRDILLNKSLWLLGITYFFISIIRAFVDDWARIMLNDLYKITPDLCLVSLQIGGFLGSLFGGALSDTVFHGKRAPVIGLFSFFLCVPLFFLSLVELSPSTSWYFVCVFYFFLGVFSFAPHVLIGLAAREWTPSKLHSTAGGFVKALSSVGAACAGAPLGAFVNSYGWRRLLFAAAFMAVLAGMSMVPLWHNGVWQRRVPAVMKKKAE